MQNPSGHYPHTIMIKLPPHGTPRRSRRTGELVAAMRAAARRLAPGGHEFASTGSGCGQRHEIRVADRLAATRLALFNAAALRCPPSSSSSSPPGAR